jgi:hypothetical protein
VHDGVSLSDFELGELAKVANILRPACQQRSVRTVKEVCAPLFAQSRVP